MVWRPEVYHRTCIGELRYVAAGQAGRMSIFLSFLVRGRSINGLGRCSAEFRLHFILFSYIFDLSLPRPGRDIHALPQSLKGETSN